MPRSLAVSAFMLGLTSLLLQVVLTRELLTSFLGNEVSIAIVLLVWLLFVALGAGPLSRWLVPRECGTSVAIRYAWAMPASALWALAVVTIGDALTGSLTGVAGPPRMLALAVVTLAPLCLTLGGLFAALCRAVHQTGPNRHLAGVYAWEAVGAVVAGLAFHLLLAERMVTLRVIWLVLAANTGIAAALSVRASRPWAGTVGLVLVALASGVLLCAHAPSGLGLRLRLYKASVLVETDSLYGSLAVARGWRIAGDARQLVFYQSGLPLFTTDDIEASEVAVHPALLAHPNPRRVLMIGGGLSGGLREVLKHPVERVDYVEIDRKLVQLARQYLPEELRHSLDDPRARVHPEDGRRFVKASRERYDVVLVLTPDPATTALGRYYTQEFDAEVRRILAPGGLLCTGLSAAQAQLTGPRLELHASVYHALQRVFGHLGVIPGERTQYLASDGPLTLDPAVLARRLRDRRVRTAFVNETWLRFQAGPFPRERLVGSLGTAPDVPANRDSRPLAAHFWLRLWLREVAPGADSLPETLARGTRWLPLLLPLALVAAWTSRRRLPARFGVTLCLAGTGFLQMGAQIALFVTYQAAVGYLYHRLGLLASLYMLGLALGAAGARRTAGSPRMMLAGTVAAMAGCALGLPVLLRAGALPLALADAAFACTSMLLGCLGGAAFAFGVEANSGDGAHDAASTLYAADLAGAAAGALLVGAVALPALGIAPSTAALGVVALALAVPLCLAPRGLGPDPPGGASGGEANSR